MPSDSYFTPESLLASPNPDIRRIGQALRDKEDQHPFHVDDRTITEKPLEPVAPPDTAVKAAGRGAVRFQFLTIPVPKG